MKYPSQTPSNGCVPGIVTGLCELENLCGGSLIASSCDFFCIEPPDPVLDRGGLPLPRLPVGAPEESFGVLDLDCGADDGMVVSGEGILAEPSVSSISSTARVGLTCRDVASLVSTISFAQLILATDAC
jgi:hypothetical protein